MEKLHHELWIVTAANQLFGSAVAALLQKYDIDGLMLDTLRQKPLIEFARRDGGWVQRYKDEHTVYFTRAARP